MVIFCWGKLQVNPALISHIKEGGVFHAFLDTSTANLLTFFAKRAEKSAVTEACPVAKELYFWQLGDWLFWPLLLQNPEMV